MKNARIVSTKGLMPEEFIDQLDIEEAAHYVDVAERDDTATLYVSDLETGKLQIYVVVGVDQDGMYTAYAAHCFMKGMAKLAMRSVFGAARIMGKPLRVHSEKVAAMAKMFGAESFLECLDADGVPMGVFNG
ncbi:MAG: hypothetical protein GQ535_11110 [Rhodobacteraceae bacterium]|nr:hypothetical protein [Paracoccaceae bacterium]